MRENKLIIKIDKAPSEVFNFTLNPKNTPLWVESIVHEETNEWPVKVGTIYKNKNPQGEWGEYSVVTLKDNQVFEFLKSDKNYHVRYTFKAMGEGLTELEYYEWVENGEIDGPFSMEPLNKLKSIMEV